MIRTGGLVLLAALMLGAAAGADAQGARQFALQRDGGPGTALAPIGDPSAIVAAEIAFVQLARDQGQWTGFARTADKDAVMFVPDVANAQRWLKKQKNPAKSVTWSPDNIYVSCDGSYAVSMGHAAWPDGRKGRFVTLWRRQQDGGYKWVIDWGSNAPAPQGTDEDAIDGKVADCPTRRGPGRGAGAGNVPTERPVEVRPGKRPRGEKYEVVRIADPPPANGEGQSRDGSLHWLWTTGAQGARTLKVTVNYGGKTVAVVDDKYTAGE